ncbi:hypothetical protein K0M31_004481, partial [Melipona bicolor]
SEITRLNLKEGNCTKSQISSLPSSWTIREQRYSTNNEQTPGAVSPAKNLFKTWKSIREILERENLDWSSELLEQTGRKLIHSDDFICPGARVGSPARADDFRRVAIDPGRKCNVRKADAAAEKHRRRTGGLRAKPWPKPSAIPRRG